jgi:hypothetical protein
MKQEKATRRQPSSPPAKRAGAARNQEVDRATKMMAVIRAEAAALGISDSVYFIGIMQGDFPRITAQDLDQLAKSDRSRSSE